MRNYNFENDNNHFQKGILIPMITQYQYILEIN